jgi:hypothetical protein
MMHRDIETMLLMVRILFQLLLYTILLASGTSAVQISARQSWGIGGGAFLFPRVNPHLSSERYIPNDRWRSFPRGYHEKAPCRQIMCFFVAGGQSNIQVACYETGCGEEIAICS